RQASWCRVLVIQLTHLRCCCITGGTGERAKRFHCFSRPRRSKEALASKPLGGASSTLRRSLGAQALEALKEQCSCPSSLRGLQWLIALHEQLQLIDRRGWVLRKGSRCSLNALPPTAQRRLVAINR